MKIKHIVTVQVVLLLGAVIAGLVLKGDLADGPRLAHRLLGSLAGIVGVVSTTMIFRSNAPRIQQALAASALILSFVAGLAGKGLKTASDYSLYFNVMRVSGVLALVCAVVLLTRLKSAKS